MSILFFTILNIFILFISPIYSKDVISCSLHDIYRIKGNGNESEIFLEGRVNVTYARRGLEVYRYDNTKYANFLLPDVDINFNGLFVNSTDEKDSPISLTLKTDIEGIAIHDKFSQRALLTDSELDLKKNIKYKNDMNMVIQEKIVDSAHVCIQTKLCEQLDTVTEGDYLRAKIENYDFGRNSVQYKAFHDSYPLLVNSEPPKSDSKAGLQISLNLLADFFLASAATQVSGNKIGKIDIPDVNEKIPGKYFVDDGFFNLRNVTFGDLTSLRRVDDVVITNDGLEFKLESGFQLTKARISSFFDFKYALLKTKGNIDIVFDGAICTVRVSMNYNRRPCVTSLTSIHFDIGKITVELNKGDLIDSTITTVANGVIKAFTSNIINAVQAKIKTVVDGLLSTFECEKYRP